MKTREEKFYLTQIKRIDANLCRCCGANTYEIREYYMVKDHIWKKVNTDKLGRFVRGGMLCIGCVEEKLERKLNKHDFTSAQVNRLEYQTGGGFRGLRTDGSDRLLDRLQRDE